MQPDGQMYQQTDGWMDDGDMREPAEGEKHFKLENRAIVYFASVRSVALHRNDTSMPKQ